MEKYKGIDQRDIKCCCNEENCRQAGISFSENMLNFHFLDFKDLPKGKILDQFTRSMYLNKQTAQALIKELKKVK